MESDRSPTSPTTVSALLVPTSPVADLSRAPELEPATAERNGRRWLIPVAYGAGAVMLVVAGLVGINAHSQLDRTHASVASTRAELHHALALVADARTELAKVTGLADAAGRTLAAASAQLASDQAKLAADQVDVFSKGVSISQLDTCVAGVEQALNQISLGDQSGAAATLNGVAANCRAAEPAGT